MNLFRRILHSMMSLIPSFITKRMLNCQDASIYLANENSLQGSLKYRIKLHTFLCLCCSNYKDQLSFIDKQVHKIRKVELTPLQIEKVTNCQSDIISKYSK